MKAIQICVAPESDHIHPLVVVLLFKRRLCAQTDK